MLLDTFVMLCILASRKGTLSLPLSSSRVGVLPSPVDRAHTPLRARQSRHSGAGRPARRLPGTHDRRVADLPPGLHSEQDALMAQQ